MKNEQTSLESYIKSLTVQYMDGDGRWRWRWSNQARVVSRMRFLYMFDFQSGHDCRITRIIASPAWDTKQIPYYTSGQ